MKIRETNMLDGIDVIYVWNTIEDVINSGRLEYLDDVDLPNISKKMLNDNDITVERLIKEIGYPFYIIDK